MNNRLAFVDFLYKSRIITISNTNTQRRLTMSNVAIVVEVSREGYGIDQIERSAMTVRELIEQLEQYDDDDIVVLSHDNGYTYGTVSFDDVTVFEKNEETDEWEKEESSY